MRDMTNELLDTTNRLCEHERYAVQIDTTRGMITIECEKGRKCATYHYRPIECLDIYYNGPIRDRKSIRKALRRSWIESTEENVKRIEDAAKIVQDLAARSFGESPMQTVMLLLEVDYPEHMTQKGVADTVDALINAGLGDASDTAELPQEEQIVDPTDALLLKISPPRFSGSEVRNSTFYDLDKIIGPNAASSEAIVFIGCGGSLTEWRQGIAKAMGEIVTPIKGWYKITTTGGRIDLVMLLPDKGVDLGKLAAWKVGFGDCSWWSDYRVNYRKQH